MLLNEALRLGAMLRPQCSDYFFDGTSSCAIGAVFEATGVATPITGVNQVHVDALVRMFPILKMSICRTPEGKTSHPLWNVIMEMNNYGMTRESVANWVQEIEDHWVAQLAQPASTPAPAEESSK